MLGLSGWIQGLWVRTRSLLLPSDGLSPVVNRNVAVNVYHGMLTVMSANLITPFFGIFAVRIGASNVQVAMLSSLPALMSLVAMIPGARFLDGRQDQKRLTTLFLLAHRLFYLLIATIPFFHKDYQAVMLVGAVALMNLPGAVGLIGWQALVSRAIPPRQRAIAFATRSRLMNLTGTITVLIAGWSIDLMHQPTGYQIVFTLAFLFALGELRMLNRLDTDNSELGPPLVAQVGAPRTPLRGQTRFIRFTLATMFFYLGWQVPWPLFTLYQVQVLGANNTWISLLSLASTGGALLGFGFWATQANRHGHLWALRTSSLGMFLVPVVYAISKDLPTLVAFQLLTGTIFSGVNLSLFNCLLEVTPEEAKATYIAYYTSAVNLVAIGAPFLGVMLLDYMSYQTAFLVAAALRMLGSLVYFYVYRLEQREILNPTAGIGASA